MNKILGKLICFVKSGSFVSRKSSLKSTRFRVPGNGDIIMFEAPPKHRSPRRHTEGSSLSRRSVSCKQTKANRKNRRIPAIPNRSSVANAMRQLAAAVH